MALAKVLSCAVVGLEAEIVECEVDVSRRGLNGLAMISLPDAAVKEAKDRVESAIKNSAFRFSNGLHPSSHPASQSLKRSRGKALTSATSKVRSTSNARSKWQPPARITCCSPVHLSAVRRSWHAPCRRSCRA